jgi:predicted RNA-binding protein (virulence factor B family)
MGNFIVESEATDGFYLKDTQSEDAVLLPSNFVNDDLNLEVGKEIKAFVYLDSQGEMICTPHTPHAMVGEYALMSVIDNQEFGAFFDWGIAKDLLVPGNEQKVKVNLHEDHIVRVCIEEGTNRVFGTTKFGAHIENTTFDIADGDHINIVPAEKLELGFRCIIDRIYIGMIYHNEIFEHIELGQVYSGVVKKVRMDGLVDAALQIQGIKNLDQATFKILRLLESNNGKSNLHDKSSPEEIKRILGMSKKTFKNSIGMLYKKKKIIISKNEGIQLVKTEAKTPESK